MCGAASAIGCARSGVSVQRGAGGVGVETVGRVVTVSDSDTRIGDLDGDTVCLRFVKGQRVRVATGSLRGLEGIVMEHRSVGRVLIKIRPGVCIEVGQMMLEPVKEKRG